MKEIEQDELDATTLFKVVSGHGNKTTTDYYLLESCDLSEAATLIEKHQKRFSGHEDAYILSIEWITESFYTNIL
jgi:hypothetical protein